MFSGPAARRLLYRVRSGHNLCVRRKAKLVSDVVSKEILDITTAEDIQYTADFTDQLYGDTLASVVSVTETTSTGLTLGNGSINSVATVSVDGRTIAIAKCCQFMIDATTCAATGDAVVRVIVLTTAGNRRSLDCRMNVIA